VKCEMWRFPSALLDGVLLERKNRFVINVRLNDGSVVSAHCKNTGALLPISKPGTHVWISSKLDSPTQTVSENKRKLLYTWEMAEDSGEKVGVNTSVPNFLIEDAIKRHLIPELSQYSSYKKEVPLKEVHIRMDFILKIPIQPEKVVSPCFVEVKNVYLRRDGIHAEFPDSVTQRGLKHLKNLSQLVQSGSRGIMLYVVQRSNVIKFQIAKDLDPNYYDGFRNAIKYGVEVLCFNCNLSSSTISLNQPIPVELPRDG